MLDKNLTDLLDLKNHRKGAVIVQVCEGVFKGLRGFYYSDEKPFNGKMRVTLENKTKVLIGLEKLHPIGFVD